MNNQPIIIFGEVLFDCFPDGTTLQGGAPFNVAWHLAAFGADPLFVSRVGRDKRGEQIVAAMQNWGMRLEGIQTDPDRPTGIVDVNFNDNEPAYDIVDNSAFDAIAANRLPELPEDSILYHGTLALRHAASAGALQAILDRASPTVFLDVNLRSPWWSPDRLEKLLPAVHWLKLNMDELSKITGSPGEERDQAGSIMNRYDLEMITLTKGAKGAVMYTAAGQIETVVPEAVSGVVDTVGAGDAFSSVLLLGKTKGWPLEVSLERAQAFAAKIVTVRSATVADKSVYQEFIKRWN